MNDIQFIESHGFVGETMTMRVNGRCHRLHYTKDCSYEQDAVNILKKEHNIDYNIKDVKFVWDGSL